MKTTYIIRADGTLSLIGAAGILIWWFMMPLFLPTGEAADHFQNLVLDPDWIAVSLVGLISILFLILGFPGFFIKHYDRYHTSGFIGLLVSIAGLILYASVQYYETIIWPASAQIDPELLQVKGALVSGDPLVVAGLLVSGVILGAGYILFGIDSLRTGSFPKVPVWFLIVGAPLFGNGILFPVRTMGLILFATGIIWMAIIIRKKEVSSGQRDDN